MAMTDDSTQQIADAVHGAMAGLPALSDFDDDEEIPLKIRLVAFPRGGKRAVSTQAMLGTGTTVAEEVRDVVEPRVDMRKAKKGRSITIGTITIRGDGEIQEVDVDPEYLKPTEEHTDDG